MQQGLNVLLGTVLERVDLSDLDVEKISGQLQKLKDKAPGLDVEKFQVLCNSSKIKRLSK